MKVKVCVCLCREKKEGGLSVGERAERKIKWWDDDDNGDCPGDVHLLLGETSQTLHKKRR